MWPLQDDHLATATSYIIMNSYGDYSIWLLPCHSAEKECYYLASGAGGLRSELFRRLSLGDVVCHGPGDSVGIILAVSDIREGIFFLGTLRRALGAVEEGDDLASSAGGVRREGCIRRALCDAVLHRPQDGLVVE